MIWRVFILTCRHRLIDARWRCAARRLRRLSDRRDAIRAKLDAARSEVRL